jgi:hypothetical protein
MHTAKKFLCSVRRLLVMAYVPSSLILVSLMMEALSFSEMSVLIRATWHNIPEDAILHSHCHENLKCYMVSNKLSEGILLLTDSKVNTYLCL